MRATIYNKTIHADSTTYNITIRNGRSGRIMLAITEHRIDAEGIHQRSTIRIFGSAIKEFGQLISEAIATM